MTLWYTPLEQIAEEHLQALVSNQVGESIRLEFKAETYGGKDEDRREFIKDISAMANTVGGDLVLGIEERPKGTAGSVSGVTLFGTPDQEMQRFTQMARSACEPPLFSMRPHAVPLANGKSVIILRVPKSPLGPHRLNFKGKTCFYARNTSEAYEMPIEQLRAAFTEAIDGEERLAAFRKERTEAIMEGHTGLGRNVAIAALHVVPLARSRIDITELAKDVRSYFTPILYGDMRPSHNFIGLRVDNHENGKRLVSYVQLSREGWVETATSHIFTGQRFPKSPDTDWVALKPLIRALVDAIRRYCTGLSGANIPPPYAVYFSLLNVFDTGIALEGRHIDDRWHVNRLDRHLLFEPVIITDAMFEPGWQRVLRPIFHHWWNSYCVERCDEYFDEDGEWRTA